MVFCISRTNSRKSLVPATGGRSKAVAEALLGLVPGIPALLGRSKGDSGHSQGCAAPGPECGVRGVAAWVPLRHTPHRHPRASWQGARSQVPAWLGRTLASSQAPHPWLARPPGS